MNASFLFNFTVEHHDVNRAKDRIEKIKLDADVQAIQPPVSVCEDITTVNGTVVTRSVKLLYSAEFEQFYPTENDKIRVLQLFGFELLKTQVPYRLPVPKYTVTFWVLNNDCPP